MVGKSSVTCFDREILEKQFPRVRKRIKIVKRHIVGDVLDVGAGTGSFYEFTNPEEYNKGVITYYPIRSYLGIEPSKEAVEIARSKGINVVEGNVNDLSFLGGKKFDTVLLLEILPHLMDVGVAFEEIKKVLAPNGKIIVSVENARHYPRVLFYQDYPLDDYHYLAFTGDRLMWLFRDLGLKIEKVYFISNWDGGFFPGYVLSEVLTRINRRFCDNIVFVLSRR